jgi:hypothetical protein
VGGETAVADVARSAAPSFAAGGLAQAAGSRRLLNELPPCCCWRSEDSRLHVKRSGWKAAQHTASTRQPFDSRGVAGKTWTSVTLVPLIENLITAFCITPTFNQEIVAVQLEHSTVSKQCRLRSITTWIVVSH